MVKQEDQMKLIWDFDTQQSVDHLLMDRTVSSIDPQFLVARNLDYTGFPNETTKILIAFIRQA